MCYFPSHPQRAQFQDKLARQRYDEQLRQQVNLIKLTLEQTEFLKGVFTDLFIYLFTAISQR